MHLGDRRARAGSLIGAAGGPVTTPGYSGRPQAAKLGLKPGHRVSLHQPPAGWALTAPPDGLAGPGPDGQAGVIVGFFCEKADRAAELGELGRRIYPAGALWVGWQRRAAGPRSDITQRFIRAQALPIGLLDVKAPATDDHMSARPLVWRVETRR